MERPEKGARHTYRFHKKRKLFSVLVLGVQKTKSVSHSLVNWHVCQEEEEWEGEREGDVEGEGEGEGYEAS